MAPTKRNSTVGKCNRRKQRGMSLVEVLISGAVLTVGVLALMGLILVSMMSNNRSRTDGTSTMLAQQVIEHIHYSLASSGTFVVDDCMGNHFTINSAAENPPNGAGAKITNSVIDYSESTPPSGYHMDFTVCDNPAVADNGARAVYDVRWNVQGLDAAGTAGWDTYLVTVAAKPIAKTDARVFALPVNMRVIVTGAYQ